MSPFPATIRESNPLYLVTSDLLCPLQIDLIVHADDEAFSVPSLVALREASKIKPSISKTAAETLLDRFLADGWLIKSRWVRRFGGFVFVNQHKE